jgi:hypothetical protein
MESRKPSNEGEREKRKAEKKGKEKEAAENGKEKKGEKKGKEKEAAVKGKEKKGEKKGKEKEAEKKEKEKKGGKKGKEKEAAGKGKEKEGGKKRNEKGVKRKRLVGIFRHAYACVSEFAPCQSFTEESSGSEEEEEREPGMSDAGASGKGSPQKKERQLVKSSPSPRKLVPPLSFETESSLTFSSPVSSGLLTSSGSSSGTRLIRSDSWKEKDEQEETERKLEGEVDAAREKEAPLEKESSAPQQKERQLGEAKQSSSGGDVVIEANKNERVAEMQHFLSLAAPDDLANQITSPEPGDVDLEAAKSALPDGQAAPVDDGQTAYNVSEELTEAALQGHPLFAVR